ncbi:DUF6745 domain-containing protein [Dactylosporangium sp. NPDC051541]|uniref:DUF6745 domain-containing protein n=1 Tax=Dactylosporangium sp. NPDC051541 TaxID=3363977 RepID=UPI0037921110
MTTELATAESRAAAQGAVSAKWLAAGLSTAPADRQAAADAVRLAYRSAGLPEPRHIVWFASPQAGARAAALLTGRRGLPGTQIDAADAAIEADLRLQGCPPVHGSAGASVRAAIRTNPWAAARAEAHDLLGPDGWAALWSACGADVWRLINDRISTPLRTHLRGELPVHARAVLLDAVGGQHDAGWLAAFDAAGAPPGSPPLATTSAARTSSGSSAAAGSFTFVGSSAFPGSPSDGSSSARSAGSGRSAAAGESADPAAMFSAGPAGAAAWAAAMAAKGPADGGSSDGSVDGDPSDGGEPVADAPEPVFSAGPVGAVWATAGAEGGHGVAEAALHAVQRLAGLAGVARSAGWWWPYANIAILTDRPDAVHRDNIGRLHAADAPALHYTDGYAIHAWRGMPIPSDLVDRLGRLTYRQIADERNAELRRVMLEHFGYDRYLREAGARRVNQDEAGTLWRLNFTDDEPLVMVEVVNSTPEPDGTSRVYWLRVPPTTRTAREGVAWTFGLTESEYHPSIQT